VAEATLDSQARAITDIIGRLLHREKVSTRDVVILLARPNDVPGLPNKTYWNALLRSAQRAKLPLAIEGAFPETKAVLVDTVKKFKGLEAQVVILWLAESLDELRDKETLYVGISRAKSRLFVVGREIAL
jgi:DNA helicase IV